jgi:hypothetical protein
MMHRSYHRYFIALGFCLAAMLAHANLIKNPEFGNNVEKWKIQKQDDTELTHTVTEDGPDGKPALEFDVTAGKNAARLSLFQGIQLKGGQTYTYTFKIKADRKRKIVVKFRGAAKPWPTIGKEKAFEISEEWQTIEFSETIPEDTGALVHIGNLGTPGKIWLSDPVLVGDGEAGTAVADAETEAEEKPKKKPAKKDKDEDETTAAASPKVELPKGIGEEGRISATDTLMKTVTVHSPKTKEDEVYQITDNTKIYVNGHDSTLANIEKGMIVVVVPDADPIMAAAIHAKAAGSKSSSAEPKKEAKAPEKDKDEDKPKAKKQPVKKKKK